MHCDVSLIKFPHSAGARGAGDAGGNVLPDAGSGGRHVQGRRARSPGGMQTMLQMRSDRSDVLVRRLILPALQQWRRVAQSRVAPNLLIQPH